MKTDAEFMARAIELAQRGLYTTEPNPRVGCVIVNNNQIVGEGWHSIAGGPHAEVHALQDTGQNAKGSTAFVSLEPCCMFGKTPPCTQALIEAGVARVVAAMPDPNPHVSGQGLAMLEKAAIDVSCGLLREQAEALNPGFSSRMSRGRPWVRVKLAMSLDGRTAMSSGESMWITGEEARHDVQRLRARASAILTGIGTILADDPGLDVRLEADQLGTTGTVRQPLKIIVDSRLRTPDSAKILQTGGDVLIASMTDNRKIPAAEVLMSDASNGRVDLDKLMKQLGKREINEVHVEAGATLCGALLEQALIDELVIYMAPHLMGSAAKGLFELPALEKMEDRMNLDIKDIRAIGKDWRITARPIYE